MISASVPWSNYILGMGTSFRLSWVSNLNDTASVISEVRFEFLNILLEIVCFPVSVGFLSGSRIDIPSR